MGRETEVYTRMYSNLLERKQQAAITKASTVSKNRILDRPYVPVYEDSPKLILHLASGVVGLILGAFIALLRGFLSSVGPTALFDLPWMPLYLLICFIFHFWIGIAAIVSGAVLITIMILTERFTTTQIRAAAAHGRRIEMQIRSDFFADS